MIGGSWLPQISRRWFANVVIVGHNVSVMNIGIIGAGHIGGTLAKQLAALGHRVTIASARGPAALAELASQLGATASDLAGATTGQDLVILSIPQKAVLELPAGLFQALPAHVPVIDTGNYYPGLRDGEIAPLDIVDSEWTARAIGRDVTKVFNSITFKSLGSKPAPKGTAGRVALPIAGNDAAHKRIVSELVDELGFDPVDAGPLSESWRQQPGTPAYCRDLDREQLVAALAAVHREDIARNRRDGEESAKARVPDNRR